MMVAALGAVLGFVIIRSFPQIEAPSSVSLGSRDCGTNAEFDFQISNKGFVSALKITSIVSDCQCMVTGGAPFELAPGESRVVRGTVMVPTNRQSVVQKIAIKSNSLSDPVKVVFVRFDATNVIEMTPFSLIIGPDHQPGRKYKVTAKVAEDSSVQIREVGLDLDVPFLGVTPHVVSPQLVELDFVLKSRPPSGEVDIQLPIEFKGQESILKNFRIGGTFSGSVQAEPSILVLDSTPGEKVIELSSAAGVLSPSGLSLQYLGDGIQNLLEARIEGTRIVVKALQPRSAATSGSGSLVLVRAGTGEHVLHVPIHFFNL